MKLLITCLLTCITSLLFQNNAYANERFSIKSHATFTVSESETTSATQNIQITNKSDIYYVPKYDVNLGIKNATNIKIESDASTIPFTLSEKSGTTLLSINFPKRIAGLGRTNEFVISYQTSDIAKKIGNLFEVKVPGLSNMDDFDVYDIVINTHPKFGNPSIVKPKVSGLNQKSPFSFSKKDIKQSGIAIVFGDEQYYSFDLSYHLNNPNLFPIKSSIALPSDTNYQEVIIKDLNPKPADVYQDDDGNWIAVFSLPSRNKQDIKVHGLARLYINPKSELLDKSQVEIYTKKDQYWEVSDNKIQQLSKQLKNIREVYNFTVNTLHYNFDKVSSENPRLGAIEVLKNPTNAVCLEFTDLFVSLSRAIGIPARAVEGFAYAENDKLKPLSLIKDVLHAWPEYYDFETNSWIMVDPTWENTTKGSDFFNILDFEHLAFVIKGNNSIYPIPAGGYKDDLSKKDVLISFADKKDFKPLQSFKINSDIPLFYLSGLPINGTVFIENTGNSKISNKDFSVYSEISGESKLLTIDHIPPFGVKAFRVSLGSSPFLTNRNYNIRIQFQDYTVNKKINVTIFPVYGYYVLGGGIIGIFIIFFASRKVRRIFV